MGDAGVAPTTTIWIDAFPRSPITRLRCGGHCVSHGRSLAVERGPDRVGDTAVGEDDAADAALDGAERGFDLDDHPARRGRECRLG